MTEKVAEKSGLSVGDVVHLRSGGPAMTVYDLLPDTDLVACIWYDPQLSLASARSQDMNGYREWNFNVDLLEPGWPT